MSSVLRLICLDDLRGRDDYDEKRDDYDEKRKAYDEKRDAYDEKRDAYDEKRKAYDEKSKIGLKDYKIILGYYRNNDYIVTGKRLHEAMTAWFCKTRILRLFI